MMKGKTITGIRQPQDRQQAVAGNAEMLQGMTLLDRSAQGTIQMPLPSAR